MRNRSDSKWDCMRIFRFAPFLKVRWSTMKSLPADQNKIFNKLLAFKDSNIRPFLLQINTVFIFLCQKLKYCHLYLVYFSITQTKIPLIQNGFKLTIIKKYSVWNQILLCLRWKCSFRLKILPFMTIRPEHFQNKEPILKKVSYDRFLLQF